MPTVNIDRKDKLIMLVLMISYAILSYAGLGSHDIMTRWNGSTIGKNFRLNLNSPTQVSKVYYYYGMGRGDIELEYTTNNNKTGNLDLENKTPSFYKWLFVELPKTAPITKINFTVKNADIELRQLALFDDHDKPITNFSISSYNNDTTEIQKLIANAPLTNYKNTLYSSMIFDEIFYARSAYEYLHNELPFVWNHPQLGILVITLGIILFGMTPLGWRFIPNLSAVLLIPVIYIFAKRLFIERRYAIIATTLLMTEFMHLSLGRIAAIDSIKTLFTTLVYYYLYKYLIAIKVTQNKQQAINALFYSGLFTGMAIATKWDSCFSIIAILTIVIYSNIIITQLKMMALPNMLLLQLIALVLLPVAIYILSYVPYFIIDSSAHNIFGFIIKLQKAMFDYHAHHAVNIFHPYASPWWSWPIMLHPMSIYFWYDNATNQASSIVLMGNPANWWYGIVAIIITIVNLCRATSRNKIVPAFIVLAITSSYLPWILISRTSFIYYFYTTVPFVIFAIVYTMKLLLEHKNKACNLIVYSYIAVAIGLFIVFFPALYGLTISRDYVVHYLLWVKGWNF